MREENLVVDKKSNESFYTLSSVFPSKEVNDIVRNIIFENNKIIVCKSLGISEEEAKLLTWDQVNLMLENRKQCNNYPKVFQILKQGNRVK